MSRSRVVSQVPRGEGPPCVRGAHDSRKRRNPLVREQGPEYPAIQLIPRNGSACADEAEQIDLLTAERQRGKPAEGVSMEVQVDGGDRQRRLVSRIRMPPFSSCSRCRLDTTPVPGPDPAVRSAPASVGIAASGIPSRAR
jgi:hypothetical protein